MNDQPKVSFKLHALNALVGDGHMIKFPLNASSTTLKGLYSRKYIGVYIQVCYDIFICSAMDEEHMKSYISRNTSCIEIKLDGIFQASIIVDCSTETTCSIGLKYWNV
ncbi:hypothetical protein EMCRGX_G033393 [Ephydatia muelleri]